MRGTRLILLATGVVTAALITAASADRAVASSRPMESAASPADSFAHARHVKVPCLECHDTGAGHGRLKFERPLGCATCHHKNPTPERCVVCHQPEEYGTPKHETLTVTVAGHQPNPRPVEFLHARHVSRTCVDCHTTPVTLVPPPEKAQCKDCHANHHDVGRQCSACHSLADPKVAHTTRDIAHSRCDACHTASTIARLTPTRSLCTVCHPAKATNHYDEKECTVCHFQSEPSVYRAKLVTPSPR